MAIIYCIASDEQGYRIVPENGNYLILKGRERLNEAAISLLPGCCRRDPYYCGYINIEFPGNIFVYTDDGFAQLDRQTINELVEIIQHYDRQNKAAELLAN